MSDRGSDGYDIDFQPEDDPAESDYTKWRVYCIHEDEFQWCYICDYYFREEEFLLIYIYFTLYPFNIVKIKYL